MAPPLLRLTVALAACAPLAGAHRRLELQQGAEALAAHESARLALETEEAAQEAKRRAGEEAAIAALLEAEAAEQRATNVSRLTWAASARDSLEAVAGRERAHKALSQFSRMRRAREANSTAQLEKVAAARREAEARAQENAAATAEAEANTAELLRTVPLHHGRAAARAAQTDAQRTAEALAAKATTEAETATLGEKTKQEQSKRDELIRAAADNAQLHEGMAKAAALRRVEAEAGAAKLEAQALELSADQAAAGRKVQEVLRSLERKDQEELTREEDEARRLANLRILVVVVAGVLVTCLLSRDRKQPDAAAPGAGDAASSAR